MPIDPYQKELILRLYNKENYLAQQQKSPVKKLVNVQVNEDYEPYP